MIKVNFYDEMEIIALLDDDEINEAEAAFMEGYLESF